MDPIPWPIVPIRQRMQRLSSLDTASPTSALRSTRTAGIFDSIRTEAAGFGLEQKLSLVRPLAPSCDLMHTIAASLPSEFDTLTTEVFVGRNHVRKYRDQVGNHSVIVRLDDHTAARKRKLDKWLTKGGVIVSREDRVDVHDVEIDLPGFFGEYVRTKWRVAVGNLTSGRCYTIDVDESVTPAGNSLHQLEVEYQGLLRLFDDLPLTVETGSAIAAEITQLTKGVRRNLVRCGIACKKSTLTKSRWLRGLGEFSPNA